MASPRSVLLGRVDVSCFHQVQRVGNQRLVSPIIHRLNYRLHARLSIRLSSIV